MKTKNIYMWSDLLDLVEKRTGKDLRDWNDSKSKKPTKKDYLNGNFPAAIWAREQGYDWTVLDDVLPMNADRMAQRIEINTKFRDIEDEDELQDQNFDSWVSSCIWYDEVSNGSIQYFNPSQILSNLEDDENKEWVSEILNIILEIFKEENLPDEIEVEVSW